MAFSGSIKKSQIPVGCQLCEETAKIQWKCLNCNQLMCTKCKGIHSKIKTTKDHRIVDIKEVGLQENFGETISFSNYDCKQHTGQNCCLFCKTCKHLVCATCIAKVHSGHQFIEEDEYRSKRKRMIEGRDKIERNINELIKVEKELAEIEKSEFSRYDTAKKDIHDQRIALKKSVDQHADTFISELDSQWKNIKKSIQTERNQTEKEKRNFQEKNATIDEVFKDVDLEKFFVEFEKLEVSFSEDIAPAKLRFRSIPKFIPGEITQANLGSFEGIASTEKRRTKGEIKITKQIKTHLKHIHHMAVLSDKTVWVGDNITEIIHRVEFEDNNAKVIQNFNIRILGMAVTATDDLLLAACKTQLTVISGKTGKKIKTNYDTSPLYPSAVHVTKDGRVIVGAVTPGPVYPRTGRRVIIVLDQEGKHLAEYEINKKNNEPLVTYPDAITTTSCGNIFVVDSLAANSKGRVIVLSEKGDVLNIYTGHPAINSDKRSFNPLKLLTTPNDYVIVTDMNTHAIHILDEEGNPISYYNTKDMGILFPHSIALSSNQNFYIGCVGEIGCPETFKAKLFELQFSGF